MNVYDALKLSVEEMYKKKKEDEEREERRRRGEIEEVRERPMEGRRRIEYCGQYVFTNGDDYANIALPRNPNVYFKRKN
jgi:hypothetical protein